MLSKQQKSEFVAQASKDLKGYKSVAIIALGGIPDRLLQLSRNRMKGEAKFILGRKTLLTKILESDARTKGLVKYLEDTSAIVLTNSDPFELYGKLKENALRLKAKPNQKALDAITIKGGETTLQPGQAVTELKQAGIDVQIQKGKVVIAKDKVIKPGEVVTGAMAKALHSLNITPFTVSIEPDVVSNGNLLFTKEILSFTKESMLKSIAVAFSAARGNQPRAGHSKRVHDTRPAGEGARERDASWHGVQALRQGHNREADSRRPSLEGQNIPIKKK